jgi:hypothetical protein
MVITPATPALALFVSLPGSPHIAATARAKENRELLGLGQEMLHVIRFALGGILIIK